MEAWTAQVALQAYPWTAEGPVWSHTENLLYWVDMGADPQHSGSVHIYDPVNATDTVVHVPSLCPDIKHVSTLALCHSAQKLILGTDNGVWSLDRTSRPPTITRVADPEPELRGTNRFNDGKVDPFGQFVLGTMSYSCKEPTGSLYDTAVLLLKVARYLLRRQQDQDKFECQKILGDVTISNGLAWDGPGTTLYYIDSPTMKVTSRATLCSWPQIRAFEYDPTGIVGAAREVFDFGPYFEQNGIKDAVPDGMCIDAAGDLWVAIYNGGCVLRVNPTTGAVTGRVDCPGATKTTCPVFAGESQTMYVTSFRQSCSGPQAGSLFRCDLPVRGTRSNLFAW